MDLTQAADLLQDLGGDRPVLHLAPANGFPPDAYHLLAEALANDHQVVALPMEKPAETAAAIKAFLTET